MTPTIQLSLYDLTPITVAQAQPTPVALVSDKRPWEMSDEEYDAWEDSLGWNDRPGFIPTRDNPFGENLHGREGVVYKALVDGENVPAHVLEDFPDLQEWHETGSSETIRENERLELERQAAIEARPPVDTEETPVEGFYAGQLVIYVDPARLEHGHGNGPKKDGDIAASYSADKISDSKGSVRKPFQFKGKLYVNTGGASGTVDSYYQAYEAVPKAQFKGETTTYSEKIFGPRDHGETARNDPNGFYHGIAVTHGGKHYVLQGPSIIFRPGKAGTAPATDLFDLHQS